MNQASAKSEALLVCLHGFTGTPDAFIPLGVPVFWAPRLSGHGPDPDLSAETFEAEVDRIAQGLTRRTEQKVHLVAYSMGARVALGLIHRFPTLFCRATLVGVNPGLESEFARQDRLGWEARWIDILEQDGLAVFEHRWKQQPIFSTQGSIPPRSQDAQRSARLSHTAAGLVHALNVLGLGSMPNYWPILPQLVVPLDLVFGALDEKFAAISTRAQSLCPTARAVAIPAVGHNPFLEAPLALRELLLAPLS